MKTVLFRTMAVLFILAVVSAFLVLSIFISYWFMPLIIVSLFFLDMADSMLEWRLKNLTLRVESPIIWGYLLIAVLSILAFYLESYIFKDSLVMRQPYVLAFLIYLGFVFIFSFRYLIIASKIATKNIKDWKGKLAVVFTR